jgi:hypothetical protein
MDTFFEKSISKKTAFCGFSRKVKSRKVEQSVDFTGGKSPNLCSKTDLNVQWCKNIFLSIMSVYIKNNNIFLVNFKCGFSTFENMRKQGIINDYKGNGRYKRVYIITRDPYKRIESFYKEKLLKNMTVGFTQHCQQKLLDYFSLDTLLNKQVTFEEFIHAIDCGYSDEHIGLQSNFSQEYLITDKIKLEDGLEQLIPLLKADPNDYIRNTTNTINKKYAIDFVNMDYTMR